MALQYGKGIYFLHYVMVVCLFLMMTIILIAKLLRTSLINDKIPNKNTDTNQILNFFLLILRFGQPPLMLSSVVPKCVQGGEGNSTSAILDLLEGFTVLNCFTVLDGFTVFLCSFPVACS